MVPAAIDQPLPAFVGTEFIGVLWRRGGRIDVWPAMQCGWNTYNAFQTAVKNGFTKQAWFSFDGTTGINNIWADFWTVFKGTYTGASGAARQFTDSTVGAIPVGGDVPGGMTKNLSGLMASCNVATPNTGIYLFYDRVLSYEALSFSTSPVSLTNVSAALRYLNGGLRCFATVQTVTGASASSWSAIAYNNQGGSGSTIPLSTSVAVINPSMTTPGTGLAASLPFITDSYGPFYPLAAGDSGVQALTSYTMTGANTGTLALVLAHPFILWSPPTKGAFRLDLSKAAGLIMDSVLNGCCLSMLGFTVGASSGQIAGNLEMAWS